MGAVRLLSLPYCSVPVDSKGKVTCAEKIICIIMFAAHTPMLLFGCLHGYWQEKTSFLLEALLSAVPDVILHAQTFILIAINY